MSAAAESSKAFAKSEQVSKLKKELFECQKEMQRLMNKKQERLVPGSISRGTLDFLVQLRRDLKQNLIDEINFKQDLQFLKDKLKIKEEYESELIARQRTQHLDYDAYKKATDLELEQTERALDRLDKSASDNSKLDELHKRRVEMEQKTIDFDVFCDSIYSTLRPKDSSAVKTTRSLGKDDKVQTLRRRKNRHQVKPQ